MKHKYNRLFKMIAWVIILTTAIILWQYILQLIFPVEL